VNTALILNFNLYARVWIGELQMIGAARAKKWGRSFGEVSFQLLRQVEKTHFFKRRFIARAGFEYAKPLCACRQAIRRDRLIEARVKAAMRPRAKVAYGGRPI
jgi:hypothetical protein